ncbi:peroxiredoxin-like family protein [Synechococcus sp. PCC 7336]|uniref:peroxiredoxin-like family protein n=1 Tax=Synechococcus sp. PCC 7336 TaxID=195250 RepID=UPI00034CA8F1|nr:peroxiredoxin-like family protein [Synechococcus sp. PCC 7336]
MTLTERLAAQLAEIRAQLPAESLKAMERATADLAASGIIEASIDAGDRAPDFTLPNATGAEVKLSDLLAKGPVVLSFYRGQWCPYCNLELRGLQETLAEIAAAGATLVAVSPQTPDNSLSTVEKNALTFEVLSDVGNRVAREYGLVFSLPEELRPIYANFGIDLPAHNGDKTFELPIAATYVIAPDGTVAHAFVEADYTKRLDPTDIVAALKGLAVAV